MARFTPLHFLLLDLSPALVGVGTLSLPNSYRRTGWLLGSIITFAMAAVCYFSIIKLARIRNRMNKFYRYRGLPLLSLSDIVFALAGPAIRAVVDICLLMAHAGLIIRCSSFLSKPPYELLPLDPAFTTTLQIRGMLLCFLLLVQIGIWVAAGGSVHRRQVQVGNWVEPTFLMLRRQTWGFMIVATTIAMGIMCLTIPGGADEARKVYAARPGSKGNLFYALRANMMNFGPIGIFLLSDMTHSWKSRFPRALGFIMLLAASFYSFFASSVYNSLGNQMEIMLMDNYPEDFALIMYLVIYFPTVFTLAVSTMMVAYISQNWEGNPNHWTRLVFLVFTSLLAAFLPEAGDVLLVLGSSVSVVVIPALIHLNIYWKTLGRRGVLFDMLLILFGYFLCSTSVVR